MRIENTELRVGSGSGIVALDPQLGDLGLDVSPSYTLYGAARIAKVSPNVLREWLIRRKIYGTSADRVQAGDLAAFIIYRNHRNKAIAAWNNYGIAVCRLPELPKRYDSTRPENKGTLFFVPGPRSYPTFVEEVVSNWALDFTVDYSLRAVAKMLGCAPSTLSHWVKRGKLKITKRKGKPKIVLGSDLQWLLSSL